MIKIVFNLIVTIFYLIAGPGQTNDLEQKINVNFNNVDLKQAINILQSNYDLKFSYVDNIIPLDTRISLKAKNESLGTVLSTICRQTNLDYQLINNHIVLKPSVVIKNIKEQQNSEESNPSKNLEPERKKNSFVPDVKKAPKPSSEITEDIFESTQDIFVSAKPSVLPYENKISDNKNSSIKINRRGMNQSFLKRWLSEKSVDEDTIEYEIRPFHLGFIYPVSTNGIEAGKYVNNFSVHILAGYSAGLDGIEFSGVGNVEKDFVKGIQFAGVANLTGKKVDGIQFSGATNITGGHVKGAQFAGAVNITAGNANGAFFAGAGNLINGYTEGGLFAGAINVVADSSQSAQFAGATNINLRSLKGFQAAGALNISGDMKGSQVAGAANIVVGDITGLQLSGALNVARNVTGSQIGVLNIADSVSGVPIGILSIVRKGYHHFEVWGGESLHTNAAFKIGVRKFYNIFALTAILEPEQTGWGLGYGIGANQ